MVKPDPAAGQQQLDQHQHDHGAFAPRHELSRS
jgi:hypothetical protein